MTASRRFWVRVANAHGSVDSRTVRITVTAAEPAGVPPTITRHPPDQQVASGERPLLKVRATGTNPLRYQWYEGRSGSTASPIRGATSRDYRTPSLTETTSYWARVSNEHGSADSGTAVISVTPPPVGGGPSPPPDPDPDPDPPPDPDPDPEPDPEVDTNPSFEQQVLTLVNQHRSAGATCGGSAYPAVGPLAMDSSLRNAARAHSADMAINDYFSHTSLDGRTFDQRIRDAGYSGGSPLGENIAGGSATPASVVSAWMSSSGHCKNIMNGAFADIGVGYAHLTGSTYRHYWTQTFGGG